MKLHERLARPTTRDVVELLREYDELKARAGGWVSAIPTADLERWEARKADPLDQHGR